MKSLLLSAALVLSASTSLASNYDDYFVDVLAWCEGNKVMTEDQNGNARVYADCEAKGHVCQAMSLEQMNRTVFTASCKPQN